ncbi:MAG: type II toxin-antitoxin system VapC family toxin [Acidobacteria bacterium]|nr:type II toxin-antitoxin system VapC family toxin [Acidobacteriota bacterium]MBV9068189.1 type II toxin-antitoxin system VapC family toxin [Acidobacteriota bacterium]MBV9187628.1 type II toxin-antitoxin system VapC family toxin [Acidobacteriota bacterium]
MDLLDINVLIYAHREDSPEHDRYAPWLTALANSSSPFALSSFTLAGFLRIVTNPRIFQPATPMDQALAFCQQLIARPTASIIQPGQRHWQIIVELIESGGVHGAMVSDTYLAALAIEHDCELVTSDKDFARFPKLRHPLNESA